MPEKRQQSLFGDEPPPPPKRRGKPVLTASVTPDDQAAADQLPAAVRLGTSSWSFPGWAGIVYAQEHSAAKLSKDGLSAYAGHPLLRTVGLDRTHYQPMTTEQFTHHAEQVPDDFRFLVKAHEWCTLSRFPEHPRYGNRKGEENPFFLDPTYATDEVVGPLVEGLGDKAGPLLFQVAPQSMKRLGGPDAFLDRLHAFLGALPRGPMYTLEIRNRELLGDRYRELLEDTGAIHCLNVHPRMPSLPDQWQSTEADRRPALVIRWMLQDGLSYEQAVDRYQPFDQLVDEDPRQRSHVADLALHAAGLGQQAFVIVNNKAEGSSPLSVSKLSHLIADRI